MGIGVTQAGWTHRWFLRAMFALGLLHKLREAMAEEMKGRVVGGEARLLRSMAAILEVT